MKMNEIEGDRMMFPDSRQDKLCLLVLKGKSKKVKGVSCHTWAGGAKVLGQCVDRQSQAGLVLMARPPLLVLCLLSSHSSFLFVSKSPLYFIRSL